MRRFPDPLVLPASFYQERQQRYRAIVCATLIGLLARLVIFLFQLSGALYFDSATLLMDSFSTLADLFSTAFLLVCIQLARRPPDSNHPLGHGRYEPLGGLQLSVFLIVLGVFLAIYQGTLLTPDHRQQVFHGAILIFPLVSVVLLEICYRIASRTAKRWNSPALTADAYHYRMDAFTSLFAAIALGIAYVWPQKAAWIDHLGAVGIALFMVFLGIRSSKENLHQLLDHVPDTELFKRVRQSAKNVRGVRETEKIHIQTYGPDAVVAIDIEVDPQMPVDQAHRISQLVRLEIQRDWSSVREVLVHIEPYYPSDHDPK